MRHVLLLLNSSSVESTTGKMIVALAIEEVSLNTMLSYKKN